MNYSHRSLLIVLLLTLPPYGYVSASQLLNEQTKAPDLSSQGSLRAKAANARYLTIDPSVFAELQSLPNQTTTVKLPVDNNELAQFVLTPDSILSTQLAAKYPNLMTYSGYQLDQPQNYGRFSISPQGFFGFYRIDDQWMLLSPQLKTTSSYYIAYRYGDALPIDDAETTNLAWDDITLSQTQEAISELALKPAPTGDQIRTYRIAISTTAEYAEKQGGTVADVVAENMILINRINQILLTDLAIQFELVDNEAIIFTTDSSDPFTNNDASNDIETNQSTIDNLIGSANYDIGHLLTTNGGGLAGVGVVCNSSTKAWGTTGSNSPSGERFYIDLVIHEFGHQLGAHHSFNAQDNSTCDSSQRTPTTAYEPGSGSTIMSYSGLCTGQNTQTTSSPYFHAASIEEIRNYITTSSGRTCGTLSALTNNIPQIQLANSLYTIPASTPFVLEGSASDADDEPLTYNWEQFNAGGIDGGTANTKEMSSDNGLNPLFRSFPATSTAKRFFPQLSDIINAQQTLGETYATTDRDLLMRVTVRDNNGGVNSEDVSISVVTQVQQFAFTSPDGPADWVGLSEQTLSWQVAQTDESPINCKNVDILYSTTPSTDISEIIISQVPNDGEQIIQVPNIDSTSVRLMLKCSDNIFFTLNDSDLSISQSSSITPVISGQTTISMVNGSSQMITLADIEVEDIDSVYPDDFTLTVEQGNDYTVQNNTITPAENFIGQLTVNITVSDGELDSAIFNLSVEVTAKNESPVALDDSASMQENSEATLISVLSNDSDINGDELSLTKINYTGQGNVSISGEQILYQPATDFKGSETVVYTVSDGQLTTTANLTITVTAITTSGTGTTTDSKQSSGGAISLLLIFMLIGLTIRGVKFKV